MKGSEEMLMKLILTTWMFSKVIILRCTASCLATALCPTQTKPYKAERAQIHTAVHKVSYNITQNFWHFSGLQPITLLNTALVLRKSACFSQRTGWNTDNKRRCAFPGSPAEKKSPGFCLVKKSVLCMHPGLFDHTFIEFNAARRASTIKRKTDVLKLVHSTFRPNTTDKTSSKITRCKWTQTWEALCPSLLFQEEVDKKNKSLNDLKFSIKSQCQQQIWHRLQVER